MNVAFEASKSDGLDWDCVVLHDVDLLPENPKLSYACGGPRLAGNRSTVIHFDMRPSHKQYKLVYEKFFGGVSALMPSQFEEANGYSNVFFGWGGEDDDLRNRLQARNMTLVRPEPDLARYWALSHAKAELAEEKVKLQGQGWARFAWDGLNSLKRMSEVIAKVEEPLYTNVTVAFKKVPVPKVKGKKPTS